MLELVLCHSPGFGTSHQGRGLWFQGQKHFHLEVHPRALFCTEPAHGERMDAAWHWAFLPRLGCQESLAIRSPVVHNEEVLEPNAPACCRNMPTGAAPLPHLRLLAPGRPLQRDTAGDALTLGTVSMFEYGWSRNVPYFLATLSV